MEEVITQKDIEDIGIAIVDRFLKPHFIEADLNATGETMDSIGSRAETSRVVFTANESMNYAIYGRGPNKDQDGEAVDNWVKWFAPNKFKPWMDAKNLTMNEYALAYTIARTGSKRFRDGNPSEYLDILKTQEVKDYIISQLVGKAKFNIQIILKESLYKLRNS